MRDSVDQLVESGFNPLLLIHRLQFRQELRDHRMFLEHLVVVALVRFCHRLFSLYPLYEVVPCTYGMSKEPEKKPNNQYGYISIEAAFLP